MLFNKMNADLTSSDESIVLASLLAVSDMTIYSRYNDLLAYYNKNKFHKATIILPLVCFISGYEVQLPLVTTENYVPFSESTFHDDIKMIFERMVRVNALQVYLVTRSITDEQIAKKFVNKHILACHMSESPLYLNADDYKKFPSIVRIIQLYGISPVVAASMLFTY